MFFPKKAVVFGFVFAIISWVSVPPAFGAEDSAKNEGSGQTDAKQAEAEQSPTSSRRVSLWTLSGLKGQFASPECRADKPLTDERLHYPRVVSAFRALQQDHSASNKALVSLYLGNAVYPGAFGRYLFSKGKEGIGRLSELFGDIPYSAYLPGRGDIELRPQQLSDWSKSLRNEGISFGAANISCTDSAVSGGRCEQIQRAPWVESKGDVKIGFVPLIDARLQALLPKSISRGLDVKEPKTVLKTAASDLREQGADVVIGLYQLTEHSSMLDAVKLGSEVEGTDLIVTNQNFEAESNSSESVENGYVKAPGTGTFVVGLAGGDGVPSIVKFTMRLEKGSPRKLEASVVNPAEYSPDPKLADTYQKISRDFCRDWGKKLNSSATLREPWQFEQFSGFVLNTLRFQTDSEVALVHNDFFANRQHLPIEGTLTLADIYTLIPSQRETVTVELSGETLVKLFDDYGPELVLSGLRSKDDNLLINGRPINKGRNYRVATTKFLAEGGNGLLSSDKIQRMRSVQRDGGKAKTAADMVIQFVRSERFAESGSGVSYLSPDENFPDLSRQFLWTYAGSFNGSYNKVTVSNPGTAYSQSQLNVQSTDQLDLEANLTASADSKNHGWANNLKLQYATARLEGDGNGFEETKDLIRGKSHYKYSGFRSRLGDQWWVPMPTAELQGESEFDKPSERDWHKLELTGIAGLRWELFSPFEVKLGFNARRDINEPNGTTVVGLNAGYGLSRSSLASVIGAPVLFESELEYFFNDIGARDIQELRNTNRLYYNLLGQLNFTTTFNAFLYRADGTPAGDEFGTNTEFLVGLNYLWNTQVQNF
jgi:hypothetical protein